MTQLPAEIRQLMWGVELGSLDLSRHRRFVIERILEYGDVPALRWVRATYGDQAIRETVCRTRVLSRRTCNFWRLILDIPKKEIKCLSKRSSKVNRFWPF